MRLLGLADACRAAGLRVVEVDGWRTRGADFPATPKVVIWHHTAGAKTGDYPSLPVVRDGREGLPGPLSQVGLGRSGTVYVIAAGKANHAGPGAWDGVTASASTVGIEAESTGTGDWTPEQRDAYPRLAAALTRLLGTTPRRNCAHREWALPAGRKPDPVGIDMPAMRTRVAALLNEEDDMFTDDDRKLLGAIAYGVVPDGGFTGVGEVAVRVRDSHALIAALYGRDAAAVAAAIPDNLAAQVADELAKRLGGNP